MNISMNLSMKNFLKSVDLINKRNCVFDFWEKELLEFKECLNPVFFEHGTGLILLGKNSTESLNIDRLLQLYTDFTWIEYALNEIYLPDIIWNNASLFIQFEIGKMILNTWTVYLHKQFPNWHFKLVLWLDMWEFPWAKIRFHKKRDSENILDENIDNYPNEWIYIFET